MNKTIAVLVLGAAIYAAQSWLLSPKTEPKGIRIGALLCLSGVCAEWGQNSLHGLQMAAEKINLSGGVLGQSIELYVEDSDEASTPSAAIRAYQKLRTQTGVNLFIGPSWTPAALALAPIAAKQEVIITSPSVGVAEFHKASPQFFNTWPSDAIATRAIAKHVFAKGYRRVAVFSSTQAWEQRQGEIFVEAFTALGGSIVATTTPLAGEQRLKTEALHLLRAKPEAIFFSNLSALAAAGNELSKLGYRGPKFASLIDATQLALANGTLEDAVFSQQAPESDWFAKTYLKRFGEAPGPSAATAYDALLMYAEAITRAGSAEPSAVRQALGGFEHRGATGPLKFDPEGGVKKVPTLYAVRDGRPSQLEPSSQLTHEGGGA